ncbi:MAG: protein kinase [Deltaproteobacteria bacterium]|nr:protein kinase [Deltaproteobacteria bacterium]
MAPPPDQTEGSDGDPRADDPRLELVRDLFGERYEIEARLSWGGLAIVYAAREPGREVAVSVLPLDCGGAPEIEDAFEIWAAGLEEFQHAGHVPVTDSGVQHGVPYLELERVEGQTLWDYVSATELAPLEALRLAVDVAKVVEAAHERDLVHWDLTPANVLIHAAGGEAVVHVLGFGVAPLLFCTKDDKSTGPTGKGSGPKAPRFLAPERRANAEGGMRADQFSLGALVYFLLRGEPPPKGRRPRLEELSGLETVVARAMKTDPAERFSDLSTLRQALEAVLVGARRKLREPSGVVQNLADTLEPDRAAPISAPPKKSRTGIWTVVAVLGALAAAAVWWSMRAPAADSSASQAHTLTRPDADALVAPAPPTPARSDASADATGETPEPTDGGEATTENADLARPAAPSATGAPLADLPELLAAAMRRVETGPRFTEPDLGPLYGYATAHPDEPRAHAVMGHVFVSMRWKGAAADAYARAARTDPRPWTNRAVLDDLLKLARDRDELFEKVWPALRNRYGRSALPAVESAMQSSRRAAQRARLRRLRSRLVRLSPG